MTKSISNEVDLREFIKEQLRPIVGKGYNEHEWESTINGCTDKIMMAAQEYADEKLRDAVRERDEYDY